MALKNPPRFSLDEHWRFFAEFIKYETAVGGPDPHLATLGEMMGDADWQERVWRAGCYASGYNVPMAEVLWTHWPFERMLAEREEFPRWVALNWPGFGLRRERRAVRTPEKFTRCVLSIADWTARQPDDWWGEADFETAWRSTGAIYGLGRYVQLKFVEALVRYCDGAFAQSDIRAQGGASPREGLALLYPEEASWLLSTGNVRETEKLAAELRYTLGEAGLEIDNFVTQVVLCEYKKCWQGKQYPGRTHDTELKYWRASQRYWGLDSQMLPARARAFDELSLGELNGWWGARENLEEVLPRYRYTWRDTEFDYWATTDPRHPVAKVPA